MVRHGSVIRVAVLACLVLAGFCSSAAEGAMEAGVATREAVGSGASAASGASDSALTGGVSGGVRLPVDSVGYALTADQIEAVIAFFDSLEVGRSAHGDTTIPESVMIGAITPHDDHLYAGPVYLHAMKRIEASVAVLIGVCHAARRLGIEGKMIFDGNRAWAGPYGDCLVSPVRERVIPMIRPDLVMVSDELHGGEHSLEALVPFLQYYRPGIEIVPVLVSRMPGELFESATEELASALHAVFTEKGWRLGADVVVLVSADCVHYGDESWGDGGYAPFGVGGEAYERAVEQDMDIAEKSLTGRMDSGKISLFRELVEEDDLHWPYKVTWCGVYSIPFGLAVLSKLALAEGRRPAEGRLLRYGTSIETVGLPLEVEGLGFTNISTLRHWVGYVAVGYW
jgi:AmmeMemoRadiSam system protein B